LAVPPSTSRAWSALETRGSARSAPFWPRTKSAPAHNVESGHCRIAYSGRNRWMEPAAINNVCVNRAGRILIASTRLFAGPAFQAWDRAQERVYSCDLTVRHVLKRRPRHDLELGTVEGRNSRWVERRNTK